MIKRATAAAVALTVLAACAGREPDPVSEYQYGDEKKSCDRLRTEMAQIDSEIRAMLPDADKTGQNVALGVAGAFFIVPLFFMDFSEAEKVEIKALRRRYNNLLLISQEKNCGFDNEPIPPFEQMEEAPEKASGSSEPASN